MQRKKKSDAVLSESRNLTEAGGGERKKLAGEYFEHQVSSFLMACLRLDAEEAKSN